MRSLSLPLCSFAAIALYATAQPAAASVIWSEEYQGYQLLEAPWFASNRTRMNTAPGETWLQINGSQGDAYVQIDAPEYAPETQSTLQFNLTIVKEGTAGRWAQGVMVFVEGYAWEIRIDVNRITFAGATTREYTAPIGLNVEHQYQLVIIDGTASLYIDSNPIEAFQNISGSAAYPSLSQVLRLGDYGGNLTGDGRWDQVRWHNTEAIPEPGGVALMFGGAAIFAGAALRRYGRK